MWVEGKQEQEDKERVPWWQVWYDAMAGMNWFTLTKKRQSRGHELIKYLFWWLFTDINMS